MITQRRIEVAAAPEAVWAVYADVERWPRWTPTVTAVTLLDPGPLRVGSRARLTQPRLPRATWTVTELAQDPARGRFGFSWVATTPGVRTTGHHLIGRSPDGTPGSTVVAALQQEGPLGQVVARLIRGLVADYLEQELQGLRRRLETVR